MAAYNAGAFIDEAIRSVLAQEGVSFELLIGDDGSTDGTWAVIQSHRADPRVRAWRFRKHRNVGIVRNALIRRGRAPCLAICDADDVMLPGNLWRLSSFLDRHPQIGVASGSVLEMDAQGKVDPRPLRFLGPVRDWDLLGMVAPHGGSVLRTALVRKVGGYRPFLMPVDDYDLFLRLAEMTRFAMLDGEPTYLWRRHPAALGCSTPPARHLLLMRKAQRDAVRRRYGVDFRPRWRRRSARVSCCAQGLVREAAWG